MKKYRVVPTNGAERNGFSVVDDENVAWYSHGLESIAERMCDELNETGVARLLDPRDFEPERRRVVRSLQYRIDLRDHFAGLVLGERCALLPNDKALTGDYFTRVTEDAYLFADYMMKARGLGVALLLCFALASCTATHPVCATGEVDGGKRGTATVVKVCGFVLSGDGSVATAAKNGTVRFVQTVDVRRTSVCGVVTWSTTIVTGE